MSSIYHENGITTSEVDYFCLVCESYIKSKEDADNHIMKPIHKKNLLTVAYCEQFDKNDRIRKFKNGYFCEFCNSLFLTKVKVKLHVQEKKHITNRGNKLLMRIENIVTAFGKIKLSESAWHGLVDQICTLCNEEFDNEGIHKTAPSHLINLIHKTVEFTSDNDIYRKIDQDTFQCLTCNKELALNSLTEHFEDNVHKVMYEKCIKNNSDNNNFDNDEATDSSQVKDYTKIVESVDALRKEEINVDFVTLHVSCLKCNEKVAFDFDVIQNHIRSHKVDVKKPQVEKTSITIDCKADDLKKDSLFSSHNQKKIENQGTSTASSAPSFDDDAIDELVKQHNLRYNRKPNGLFCNLCEVSLPMAKTNIIEHVNGLNHKTNQPLLTEQKQKPSKEVVCPRKVPLANIIRQIQTVENMHHQDMIINQEFCIKLESILCLHRTSSGNVECFPCEMNFNAIFSPAHILSFRHKEAIDNALVVLFTGEFIREVGNKLHCGFCNSVEVSWGDMVEHLKTGGHLVCKNTAKTRLEDYRRRFDSIYDEMAEINSSEILIRMRNGNVL